MRYAFVNTENEVMEFEQRLTDEAIAAGDTLATYYHPDFHKQFIPLPNDSPVQPCCGWHYVDGEFLPPVEDASEASNEEITAPPAEGGTESEA